MRFTRGDVHPKSIMDLRSGAKERRSRREAQRSTFARFFGLFDFRLLQQYLPLPDSCTAANINNVQCIHVPVEKLSTAPITDSTYPSCSHVATWLVQSRT